MKRMLTKAEKKLEEIVLEHTRLVKEYHDIYNLLNMEHRRESILRRIDEISEERYKLLKMIEL